MTNTNQPATPADEMRHAAALMRGRARSATPGAWTRNPHNEAEVWQHESLGTDLMVCDTTDGYGFEKPGEGAIEDAVHIASWHPVVALAVADLLDKQAVFMETGGDFSWIEDGGDAAALKIARAYLGVSS